jgi:hypothetical protein
VVVSVDSSLSVEALLSGTCAINVLTDSGWRNGPSFAADTGVIEVIAEEIAGPVLNALERRPMDARGLAAAKAAYHPAPADPIKNVVDWILALP